MSAEPLALSTVPPEPPADTDYDAICAAVTATARGRWFLDEFAKRNRNTDTTRGAGRHRPHGGGGRRRARPAGKPRGPSGGPHRAPRNGADDRAGARRGGREPARSSQPDAPSGRTRWRRTSRAPPSGCGRSPGRCAPAASSSPLPTRSGRSRTTILSADALRDLGEQRAQKLTEALHYLEHRIDRMLDGHAARLPNDATAAEPVTDGPSPVAERSARPEPTPATTGGGDDRGRDAPGRRNDGRSRARDCACAGSSGSQRQRPWRRMRSRHRARSTIRRTTTTMWCCTVADSASRDRSRLPPAAVVATSVTAGRTRRAGARAAGACAAAGAAARSPDSPASSSSRWRSRPRSWPRHRSSRLRLSPMARRISRPVTIQRCRRRQFAATAVEPNAEPDEPDSRCESTICR